MLPSCRHPGTFLIAFAFVTLCVCLQPEAAPGGTTGRACLGQPTSGRLCTRLLPCQLCGCSYCCRGDARTSGTTCVSHLGTAIPPLPPTMLFHAADVQGGSCDAADAAYACVNTCARRPSLQTTTILAPVPPGSLQGHDSQRARGPASRYKGGRGVGRITHSLLLAATVSPPHIRCQGAAHIVATVPFCWVSFPPPLASQHALHQCSSECAGEPSE